jgi:hypothetical protein
MNPRISLMTLVVIVSVASPGAAQDIRCTSYAWRTSATVDTTCHVDRPLHGSAWDYRWLQLPTPGRFTIPSPLESQIKAQRLQLLRQQTKRLELETEHLRRQLAPAPATNWADQLFLDWQRSRASGSLSPTGDWFERNAPAPAQLLSRDPQAGHPPSPGPLAIVASRPLPGYDASLQAARAKYSDYVQKVLESDLHGRGHG